MTRWLVAAFYAPVLVSAAGAFVLSAAALARAPLKSLVSAAVCFAVLWLCARRLGTVWRGEARRPWADLALCAAFLALLLLAGRRLG